MTHRICTEENGWAGIQEALAVAGPGDVVALEPGTYEGNKALRVGAGVTLQGAGINTRLIWSGFGPAIMACDTENVTIRELHLDASQDTKSGYLGGTAEVPLADQGVLWLHRVCGAMVESISLVGMTRPPIGPNAVLVSAEQMAPGISVTNSQNVSLRDNTVLRAANGIALLASSNCYAEGNFCHNNTGAGISLLSSSEIDVFGNECRENGGFGILLKRNPSFHLSAPKASSRDNRAGIFMKRHTKGRMAPSRASLRANRCYENANGGIVLMSTEANEITDNECWGNEGHGISLSQEFDAAEASFVAILRANRCYDNEYAGIFLASSKATEIVDNECWGNGASGIALQEVTSSSGEHSIARIGANVCCQNGQSGILLFSSEAVEIVDNECWGHDGSGIALQRSPNSPELPSIACLYGNHCYLNSQGIELRSSIAPELAYNECSQNSFFGILITHLEGVSQSRALNNNILYHNECGLSLSSGTSIPDVSAQNTIWGNVRDPVWHVAEQIGRNVSYHMGARLPIQFLAPTQTPEQYEAANAERRTVRLAQSRHGALTLQLEAEGISDAEVLARFLCGPGSTEGLHAWWRAHEPWRDKAAKPVPRTENEDGPRLYKCTAEHNRLILIDSGSGAPTRAIWRAIGRAARDEEHGAIRLGIVDSNDDALTALKSELAHMRKLWSGHEGDWERLPPAARYVGKDLHYANVSIGDPLLLDHTERSAAALARAEGMSPMLDAALLGNRSPWREALRLLLRTPAAWIWTLGSLVALFLFSAAFGFFSGAQNGWSDLFGAAFWAWRQVFVGFDILETLLLPSTVLMAIGGVTNRLVALLPSALRPDLPRWAAKLLKLKAPSEESQGAPWRRWVRMRVFEQDVAIVALRNVQEWSAEDAKILRDLVARDAEGGLRPERKSLALVLQAPSRGLVDRSILLPFLPDASEKARALAALEGMNLSIGRDPEPLQVFWYKKAKPIDLAVLLGIRPDDDSRLSSLRSNLRDEAWSPSDILPMLVLGSTLHLAFRIEHPANEIDLPIVLADAILPYMQLWDGDPDRKLDLVPHVMALLQRCSSEEASIAGAVYRLARNADGREVIDLIGQAGRRQITVMALSHVFDSAESHRAYVSRALACGLLHAMRVCRDALAIGRVATGDDLRLALRALRSAKELSRDLETAGWHDPTRQRILDAERAKLVEALNAARIAEDADARRSASLLACRADAMGLLDGALAVSGDCAVDGLVGALHARLTRASRLGESLDHRVAVTRARQMLRHEISEADAALAAQIEKILAGSPQKHTIMEVLAEVEDGPALRQALKNHAGLGPVAQNALWVLFCGCDDNGIKLRAARVLNRLRSDLAHYSVPERGALGARIKVSLEQAARLIEALEEEETIQLLSQPLQADALILPNIELGFFDPADQDISEAVEIERR